MPNGVVSKDGKLHHSVTELLCIFLFFASKDSCAGKPEIKAAVKLQHYCF